MPAHLTFPLRLGRDGSLASAEQDSPEEVESAIYGVIAQRKGYRTDRPEIGIDAPEFEQGGADLPAITRDLLEQEPRAQPALERDPTLLARLMDDVAVIP